MRLDPRLRPGFTLIELLIAMVVMSIALLAIMELFSRSQGYFIDQNAAVDLQEDARNPLAWLARDIKSAVGVEAAWGSFTSSGSTLILRIPAIDADGRIVDVKAVFDRIVYDVVHAKLRRTFDALDGVSARQDSSRYLGDNVTSFTAAYYDAADVLLASGFATAAAVRVSVAVSLRGFQRTFHEDFGSKFKLRNKPAAGG